MSDNMPDFDNMTPEEIMAWMETLAKRQGASEGFTTAADMDIAEVDPNSVVIDEPGYVPYGQESSQSSQRQQPAPVKPPEPARAPAPPPARSTFQSEPPAPSAGQVRPLSPIQPARPPEPTRAPAPPPPPPQPEPVQAAPEPVVGEGALAWLESLAADQGEELFNLDLSGLPGDIGEAAEAEPASPPVNPMTWLEDLARAQVAEPSLEPLATLDEDDEPRMESEKLDPFAAGVNPMEWLETLAKRQGAKQEELTTRASMNIPAPPETEVEQDDYQPFSFDTPPTRRSAEPAALEDPAQWLNSIAGSEGYSEAGVLATQMPDSEAQTGAEDMSLAEIEAAIANGTVTSSQMQYFLDQQAAQLAEAPEAAYEDDYSDDEPTDTVDEADAAVAPAELPDWLSELKPAAPEPSAAPTQSLDSLFAQPAEVEIPSWLTTDALTNPADDLESIFEPDDEASRPMEPISEVDAPASDTSDTWVEAFDEEYAQGGQTDTSVVPEWYEQNVSDPERIAAVDAAYETTPTLDEAALPEESSLPAGQPQSLPSWITGFETIEEIEQEYDPVSPSGAFEEMPDWLKEVEASVSPDDVPDWLVETIDLADQAAEPEPEPVEPPAPPAVVEPPPVRMVEPTPTPAPVPVRQVTPPPAPKPAAPLPVRIPIGEAAVVLERARDREQSGDLEGALTEYETMIRSSVELDAVVDDLSLLVKSYRTMPSVYRVLGDGLMRQGKLQAALNTYREALNQL